MRADIQPGFANVPGLLNDAFEIVEQVCDQARPGDADDRGYTLCLSDAGNEQAAKHSAA